jgi:hypothetical protein
MFRLTPGNRTKVKPVHGFGKADARADRKKYYPMVLCGWTCVRVEIFLWQAKRTLAAPEPTNRNFALACCVVNANYNSFSLLTGKGSKILPSLIIQ